MDPQKRDQILREPALRPVPGKDYGGMLADEIRRLRRDGDHILRLIEQVAGASGSMEQAAVTYGLGMLKAARRVLPDDVDLDDVADGETLVAMLQSVECSPFAEGLQSLVARGKLSEQFESQAGG